MVENRRDQREGGARKQKIHQNVIISERKME